ncbi:MAG: hypothetical protein M3N12_01805 [Verrucomicrobiota bacterium]|nr:hypothetical protein [Verrucomicrobiota bacterium]
MRRRVLCSFSRACLSATAFACASCGFFQSQPALPKRAAIESRVTPEADAKFDLLVQNADIIYLPTELFESATRPDPAWKLVEALQRHGDPFAIGLDLIDGDGQSSLDEWMRPQVSTDRLFSRLSFSGTARERDNCRTLLRETKRRSARFLALGRPLERPATPPQAPSREVYETEEEFAAARVAQNFRDHSEEKLLLFLHRQHLGSASGVPALVAQKIKARQLVLDSLQHPSPRSPLLTGAEPERLRVSLRNVRRFEIVDGAPAAGRDQL